MDWTQTFTIIGTMIGAVYAFYHITDKRIDRMEEHHRDDIKKMDDTHREDIQRIDSKWDEALQRMDAKWERLFERLLLQDQQKNSDANKAT